MTARPFIGSAWDDYIPEPARDVWELPREALPDDEDEEFYWLRYPDDGEEAPRVMWDPQTGKWVEA